VGRVLLINLVAGFLGGTLAWQKGRNIVVWFAVCFLLPLAVVVVGFLPSVVAPGRTKPCPRCGNVIAADALHCIQCGHDLPIEMRQCRQCGRVVRDGDFCSECGGKLAG